MSTGIVKRTIHHVCIDLEGVRRWTNKDLERLFTCQGEKITAREIREWIDEQLAEGIRVIPFGEACNNFDHVNGCKGHPIIEEN